MLSKALMDFHDAVFVITAPGFDVRHSNCTRELGEDNFEFVFGIDKNEVSLSQLSERGDYDEVRAMQLDRLNETMSLGHVCCSIGHLNVYRKMVEDGIERALIFEDDVYSLKVDESEIAVIVSAAPRNAEMIYWGWEGGERIPRLAAIERVVYKLLYKMGKIKLNETMIDNLYSRDHDRHFRVAGKHFLAHAYTLTLSAAKKMLSVNYPVAMNADKALTYAILNGEFRAYLSKTQLFEQHSTHSTDAIESLESLTVR